jgi:hypothetical protein
VSLLFDLKEYETPVTVSDDWCNDNWETPDQVAAFMGSLVQSCEHVIAEPSAGTGRIARHLPNGATCVELNPLRHVAGAVPSQRWICDDFIGWATDYMVGVEDFPNSFPEFDLVIGNPPFSLGSEFLDASAQLIKKTGRILFLLPTQYFQAQERAAMLRTTGLVISKQWAIAGRVGYLKDGIACNQRQCYDSVFEFRHAGTAEEAIAIVDPYGKL